MNLKEQEMQEIDPKVQEILEILRDNRFASETSRKHFISLISNLHNTNDRVARILFRKLGDYCTTLVPQILGESIENDKEVTVSEIKPYQKLF